MRLVCFASLIMLTILFCAVSVRAENNSSAIRFGFSEIDITPKVGGKRPVYLAGYGYNRKATGVHDSLMARCVMLENRGKKFAFVSLDLVGLHHPHVLEMRAATKGVDHLMVSCTHNHEGPDVMGIWGSSPFRNGTNPKYLARLVTVVSELVAAAEKTLTMVNPKFGTAKDENLLGDSRLPKVYDGVLRVLRFDSPKTQKPLGLLVQWNCHPEAMGSRNTKITADFPAQTISELKKKYACPVGYFTGAVGGLMAPPSGRFKNKDGKVLKEGDFEFMKVYGQKVAKLAQKAIDSAKPIELSNFQKSTKVIALPLRNPLYKLARAIGVIKRKGCLWTGDHNKLGAAIKPEDGDKPVAAITEIGYLRLGQLHIACIPGELYPELVYGKYQTPVDPAADFPKAKLEKPITQILPSDKFLLFGLANDEIGYIIPRRQWDFKPPFAYGRKRPQYGEINSCGPEVGPIIMKALEERVQALNKSSTKKIDKK